MVATNFEAEVYVCYIKSSFVTFFLLQTRERLVNSKWFIVYLKENSRGELKLEAEAFKCLGKCYNRRRIMWHRNP